MDVYIDFRGEKQHNHCIVIEDGLYYNIGISELSIPQYVIDEANSSAD